MGLRGRGPNRESASEALMPEESSAVLDSGSALSREKRGRPLGFTRGLLGESMPPSTLRRVRKMPGLSELLNNVDFRRLNRRGARGERKAASVAISSSLSEDPLSPTFSGTIVGFSQAMSNGELEKPPVTDFLFIEGLSWMLRSRFMAPSLPFNGLDLAKFPVVGFGGVNSKAFRALNAVI